MDEFSSLISLQEDDSYPFQHIAPTAPLEQQTIKQDLVIPGPSLTPAVLDTNELTVDKKGKKQRKTSTVQEDGNGTEADNKQRRIVHRDIERQRRQEMAGLYSSLRTLLPLEYIRGKRSICDQVNEAVNYIKYQEKNIKHLQSKRDKLRNLLDASSSDPDIKEGSSRKYSAPIEVSIRPCSHGGFEILISNEVGEERFPISSVLEVLVEEGLSVVSCFCTKVNDKFLYTIQTEVTDITGFHLRYLPQKLSDKIKAPINIRCYSGS